MNRPNSNGAPLISRGNGWPSAGRNAESLKEVDGNLGRHNLLGILRTLKCRCGFVERCDGVENSFAIEVEEITWRNAVAFDGFRRVSFLDDHQLVGVVVWQGRQQN
jgi:hypothetical protein